MSFIRVTLDFSNAADCAKAMSALAGLGVVSNEPTAAPKPAATPTPSDTSGNAGKGRPAPATGQSEAKASTASTASSKKPAAEAEKTANAETGSEQPEGGEPETALTYPDVQKLVFALSKVDKSAAIAIAKGLGAETFKEMKPESWPEAVKQLQAKIDEVTKG